MNEFLPREGQRYEGAAFPFLVKAIATLLMISLVYWGYQAARVVFSQGMSYPILLLFIAAFVLTFVVYYWILRSRTSINSNVIEQTWIWHKQVSIAKISQLKFIYIPYLSWLLAPRLVVRSGVQVHVFHSADPRVLAAFAALSLPKTFD